MRDQSFPAPVRLGAAITAWKVGDIRQWLAAQAAA
ncbi:helix-turn-helix transcriptional regulator [Simplicispira metamorpha]